MCVYKSFKLRPCACGRWVSIKNQLVQYSNVLTAARWFLTVQNVGYPLNRLLVKQCQHCFFWWLEHSSVFGTTTWKEIMGWYTVLFTNSSSKLYTLLGIGLIMLGQLMNESKATFTAVVTGQENSKLHNIGLYSCKSTVYANFMIHLYLTLPAQTASFNLSNLVCNCQGVIWETKDLLLISSTCISSLDNCTQTLPFTRLNLFWDCFN